MVFDNCVRTGCSKVKVTPPIKKVNSGNTINIPRDIKKGGIGQPDFSCCIRAYLNTKNIATIAATIEYKNTEKFVQTNLGI